MRCAAKRGGRGAYSATGRRSRAVQTIAQKRMLNGHLIYGGCNEQSGSSLRGGGNMNEYWCDCDGTHTRVFQYRGPVVNPRCPGCGHIMTIGRWFDLPFAPRPNAGVRYYDGKAHGVDMAELMRMAALRAGVPV